MHLGMDTSIEPLIQIRDTLHDMEVVNAKRDYCSGMETLVANSIGICVPDKEIRLLEQKIMVANRANPQ